MKACRQTRRLLELQFAGELSWKQELQLTEHLAGCAQCAAEAQDQDHVLEGLDGFREAPLAKIDVDRFVQKVQDRIADEPVGGAQVLQTVAPKRLKTLALAAAVLAVVGLAWVLRGIIAQPAGENPGQKDVVVVPDALEFQEDRHRAAVAELRGALASLEGESPDWDSYGGRAESLRTSGWPMASLLSGLLGDDREETARAAILALGSEGGSLAHRRLWNLRGDDSLGSFAVSELEARGMLTTKQTVELYWQGTHRSAASRQLALLSGDEALEAARLLVRESSDRRVATDSYHQIASVLGRAQLRGQEQALEWLQSPRLDRDSWAMHIAMHDLSEAFEGYLANGSGSRWEAGALALAAHYPNEGWIEFLEESCGRSRTAGQAVRVLGSQPGMAALELLFNQESNRMVDEEVWLDAWVEANAGGASRLGALAYNYRREGTRSEREHLGEVLLLGSHPGSGEALVELASAKDLSERLRCSMVLQAGREGNRRAAYGLENLYTSLERKDSSLAACVIIALSQLGEEADLIRFLQEESPASEATLRAILALCDPKSRRSERERRYLIARKLKPILGKRNLSSLE